MSDQSAEESVDLKCLFAMRDARFAFFDAVVAHARKHAAEHGQDAGLSKDDVDLLRSNDAFHIAEFYYLIQQFELGDPRKIRFFLQRHNDDIRKLLADKERRESQGLSKSRLEEGLFSDQQIEKVVHQISDNRLRLDQSDLGRLLSSLISAETTRKAVVALAKGGLLHRVKIGQVLVVSTGILERYFQEHLQAIVGGLQVVKKRGAKGS